MLTKTTVALSVLCLVLPAAAFAQGFSQGSKEVLLNGSGVSDKDFDSTVFSVQGSFGYFFSKNIEASIRQSISFTNTENVGSAWTGTTRGALDYHLDLGRFWPFVGGNIGYMYGHHVRDTWEGGVEGGLKFFVNSTTFLLGMVEYDWFFNNDENSSLGDAQWVYVVGIGFKW